MELKHINKKGQNAGGFAIILPIVISLMVAGFVLTVMTDVNSDIATGGSANTSAVSARVNTAAISFAGNFGTFFSLALLAVIIGIVAVFLVRRG
jgi:uncharacterized membrane protein